jgi:soluble lytic murein transglycosylase-like protein
VPIRSLLRTALAAAALSLVFPLAVHAQIYAWRDAHGNLVLSDKAKDPSAKTYDVATGSTAFRTTKPLSSKAAQYHSLIEEHSTRNGVSQDLVHAVIQAESAFNPRARSPKGAMGLMQLMPATATEFGVIDPYNPVENVRAGVKYLKQLLDSYAGKVELALAAYNAGPGAVKKYGGTVPPYRETRNYVAKIQGTATGAAGTTGTLPGPGERTQIFRTVEIVDGREVVRYTGTPRAGSETVKTAERR